MLTWSKVASRRGAMFVGVGLVLVTLTSACGHVAAYERERLAHPTMDPENGNSPGLEHVRAVQEGATGGQIGVGSGCGCN